jgi:transcriptional regulator with XRE-family HTH domain
MKNNKDDIKRVIAENIKKLRNEKNISRRELARRAGIDEKQLRRYEGSEDYEFMPSVSTLIGIVNALDAPLWLLFIEVKKKDIIHGAKSSWVGIRL